MIHNLEINVRVDVNDLSEEQYEKIMNLIKRCVDTGFGLEDWEFMHILNPTPNRRRSFFPSEYELPELTCEKDSPVVITKINLVS